jgi:uncharacterized protein YukE
LPGTGNSVIGQLQEAALATAENLDTTAENVREFEPGLRDIWAHQQEAMGDTHQDDVPQLEAVVEEAVQAINECADTIAECAQKVREVEENT